MPLLYHQQSQGKHGQPRTKTNGILIVLCHYCCYLIEVRQNEPRDAAIAIRGSQPVSLTVTIALRQLKLFKATMIEILCENLSCPSCKEPHFDIDEWALEPHKTHLCLSCGELFEGTFKAASYPTLTAVTKNFSEFIFVFPE
ncbi:MAG: hypothetical protein KME22_07890 [Hassallia sp. WJT32-NPBG1]|nr:hypothetical protein [Hassallia sp. WJT32-NPBG1]